LREEFTDRGLPLRVFTEGEGPRDGRVRPVSREVGAPLGARLSLGIEAEDAVAVDALPSQQGDDVLDCVLILGRSAARDARDSTIVTNLGDRVVMSLFFPH